MNFVGHVRNFAFAPGNSMQLDPTAFIADSELVEALAKRATPLACESDRVLFRQGDEPAGLYILQSGQVTLSMHSATGEPVLSFETGAGSLLGLPGMISRQPYTLAAVARAGSKICFITHEQFGAFMQSYPQLALKILQVLAAEVSAARRAMSA